ncbi:MAG: gamma carbonic anhydrase family protein [Candidatus Eisenbacteria bacterium]|nr:gamma carbonic anhydrase family protein [Candidatus Eisenbacteria bacterium]
MIAPYKGKAPKMGNGVFVAPDATVIGDVSIGDSSSVWFNAVIRGDVNFVKIGDSANVQDSCVLHVAEDFPLYIGNDVTVGHGCVLHGCKIGNRCLIGMGAVILDGAEIGEGSLIASGSVVLEGARVPPGTLVAGVPAVRKRELDSETLQMIERSAADYVELAKEYLAGGHGRK